MNDTTQRAIYTPEEYEQYRKEHPERARIIRLIVNKAVKQYGEVFRLLARE